MVVARPTRQKVDRQQRRTRRRITDGTAVEVPPSTPDTPRADPPAERPPEPPQAVAVPTGPVETRSPLPGRPPFGIDWSRVTRWYDQMEDAGDELGVPVPDLAATATIESQGDPRAVQRNPTNGDSFGLGQIVAYGNGWDGWHELVVRLAGIPDVPGRVREALFDPAVNLRVTAAILRQGYDQYGSWDQAASWFFTGKLNWNGQDGVNGTTGDNYARARRELVAEWEAAAGDTPTPKPAADLIAVIVGSPVYDISFDFRARGGKDLYRYGIGHGLDGWEHTGIDVSLVRGTTLNSPIDGTIACSFTDDWPGANQSGCAAFGDLDGGGVGRVEILADDGLRSLILGHSWQSLVATGRRVRAGDPVARSGGMFGGHSHVEGRRWVSADNPDGYTIEDPRVLFAGGPSLPVYAGRLAVPQPGDFENGWVVTTTRKGVPVRQRADPRAPEVAPPLAKGEEFTAVMLMIGLDNQPWWVSSLGGRVPLEGTTAAGFPAIR